MTTNTISQTAQMAAQASSVTQLKGKTASVADAQAAGHKFEAMFISQMLKPMFDTIPTDVWFGGGQGEEMFRGMLVDNYGKEMANHGKGIGIAAAVTKSLLKAQEVHA